MLYALIALSSQYTFSFSELAGGCHGTTIHYTGRAVDITHINGQHVDPTNPGVDTFVYQLYATGAASVCHPKHLCGSSSHKRHVHAYWYGTFDSFSELFPEISPFNTDTGPGVDEGNDGVSSEPDV
jgi:hypothetical protein